MPFESTGNGISVGSMPSYADKYGEIQQGLAHRFDQYVNPFLLAHNISDVFQPGIQNAQHQQQLNDTQSYQQGMLGVERARQQLAATAQNSLLPLQANLLDAQATNIGADAARTNFMLDQTKQGISQIGAFATALNGAKSPEDVQSIAGQFPDALSTPQGQDLFNKTYGTLSQRQGVQQSFAYQSAVNQGKAMAFDIPEGKALTDVIAEIPKPDSGDPVAVAQYSAKIDGLTQQYSGTQQMQLASTLKLANTQLQTNGKIDASLISTLRSGLASGKLSPSILQAANLSPEAYSKLQAALAGQADASGQITPSPVAVASINSAKSILANPMATTTEKNWAYDAMNTHGNPSYRLPVIPPAAQDQVDLLTQQIQMLQNAQPKTRPYFGGSEFDKANQQIMDLKKQVIDIKNNSAQTPNSSMTSGFGQNPFNPYGVGQTGTPPSANPSAPAEVPGNPQTTAALQATQPSPEKTQPAGQALQLPDEVLSKLSPPDQQAYAWLQKNPNNPNAAKVAQRLKNLISTAQP